MLRRTAIVAVFVLGLVAPQMAHAQRQPSGLRPGEDGRGASEQQQAARGVQNGVFVQMAQVSSALNRRTPGEMQDATLVNGDRPVYRVRWKTSDGKRIDYVIDARTGSVLSSNGG